MLAGSNAATQYNLAGDIGITRGVMGAGNAFSGMFTQAPQQPRQTPAFSSYWNYGQQPQPAMGGSYQFNNQ
jgi:hypothetical protein